MMLGGLESDNEQSPPESDPDYYNMINKKSPDLFQAKESKQISVMNQNYPASENHTDLCRVCEDVSTGKHYGQISCEGCKSFFKRSIRRKIGYICRNNGQCKISKELRNQCQACRFLKCQQMGMRKVQTTGNLKSQSSLNKEIEAVEKKLNVQKSVDGEDTKDWDSQYLSTINLSIKYVLNSILQAENYAPILSHENFVDQSMNIIYSIVKWSQKLLFCDRLELTDKILLIQKSWCQLFILNYSMCGLSNNLLYNGNSSNNSFHVIQNQLLVLNKLSMDAIEIGCLKAIIFFDPDTHLLFDYSLTETAQKTFQEALESHIYHNANWKNRFGRLLLRIPYLKEVKVEQILEVFFNKSSTTYINFINELFQTLMTSNKDFSKHV